ncbi:MAG: tetratricopeptide repeat protein, partial [Spirochaetales bacterium]|nr:tetratricopeptide repeat protein [Spirochaetales bacterium]
DKQTAGARANNFIGDVSYGKGEYKEALSIYAATVSAYKTTADEISEALYKMAYCYYKLGAKDQAGKYADMVVSRYPDSQWAANAKTLKGGL